MEHPNEAQRLQIVEYRDCLIAEVELVAIRWGQQVEHFNAVRNIPSLSLVDLYLAGRLGDESWVLGDDINRDSPDCFSQPPTMIAEWASDRESGPEPS